MGFLRLYLAMCVVSAHVGKVFPWQSYDGSTAVQVFFVISGFYMQLIAQKYTANVDFYKSRIIRLYPTYFLAAIAALVINLLIGTNPYPRALITNGAFGVIVTTVTNLTIVGQDLVMFLRHDVGESLQLTANYTESKTPLFHYLLIPQAWSISLEIVFYSLVPMLAKLRTRTLILTILVCLIGRVFAYEALGLMHDPWTYRFFPFELGTFIAGMLACRYYKTHVFKPRSEQSRFAYMSYCVGIVLVVYLTARAIGFGNHFLSYHYSRIFIVAGWAILIPYLFHLMQFNSFDRHIGELSYPIYLFHLMIASIGLPMWSRLPGLTVAVATTAVSILASCYFIEPIEQFRKRYATSNGGLLFANPNRSSQIPHKKVRDVVVAQVEDPTGHE